jgi:hypothetical protein
MSNMYIHTGLEATTYELMTSLGNAAQTVSGILATQLLWPMNANGCEGGEEKECGTDEVDISSGHAFDASNGPARFTRYELLLRKCVTLRCVFFVFIYYSTYVYIYIFSVLCV